MWKEGLMREFHWALSLSVAACLMGAPAHADRFDDRFGEVVVVTHVDVDPQNVPVAEPLLVNFVIDSRNDRGVKSFTLITQEGTDNHFQLIEVFRDMRAFDAHVSAAHTVTFRANLDPLLGAPYDERLYQVD
jgi:quinol monooxygenase YgiN